MEYVETKLNWKVHECHDPINEKIEETDNYYYCYGTCPDCGNKWCFGIINKACIAKLKEWKTNE